METLLAILRTGPQPAVGGRGPNRRPALLGHLDRYRKKTRNYLDFRRFSCASRHAFLKCFDSERRK